MDARPLSAFDAIFASRDPFGTPFQPSIARKALLFPVPFTLEKGQFEALASAAAAIGENDAYCACTENWGDDAYSISLDDFAAYEAATENWHGMLENAVFSREGTWGLLFSHENHVVAGGPLEFIEAFLDHIPGTENPPQSIDVTPDMEPFRGTDINDITAHYVNQGARVTEPPVLPAREQAGAFVAEARAWRHDRGTDLGWLPLLVEHLYGAEESQKLLSRAGIASDG